VTKQEVIPLIESLPDDATTGDILYKLYVRAAVEGGFADIEAGRTVSHGEVRRMVERWLFETPRELAPDA
jgi:predicted transcriptional regulator